MNYVSNGEEMIITVENYLGEVVRATWEAYKKKFLVKLVTMVQQRKIY